MARGNMVGTSVRLPRSVLERLEAVAERSRWSKGELHRQALEAYLLLLEGGLHVAPWYEGGEDPGDWEEVAEDPDEWEGPEERPELHHEDMDDQGDTP